MISSCMFSSAPIDAEEQRHERNHPEAAAGETPHERGDDRRQRAEPIDDDPRAADEQHDGR